LSKWTKLPDFFNIVSLNGLSTFIFFKAILQVNFTMIRLSFYNLELIFLSDWEFRLLAAVLLMIPNFWPFLLFSSYREPSYRSAALSKTLSLSDFDEGSWGVVICSNAKSCGISFYSLILFANAARDAC
jgi:hypothetical protein